MLPVSLQFPPQTRDAQGHILTHGFVHGHVHQHRDHVHIHGHIHNHDHVEPVAPVVPGGVNATSEAENSGIMPTETSGLDPSKLSELECKELANSLDLCNDIFCDELDDCYYYDCDKPGAGVSATDNSSQFGQFRGSSQCQDECPEERQDECHDECSEECHDECPDSDGSSEPSADLCTDSGCIDTDHYDHGLCELQKPRLTIFENLIQKVHHNIEQYVAPAPVASFTRDGTSNNERLEEPQANRQLHIHFPHHCHGDLPQFMGKDNPVLPNVHQARSREHTMHQSCFHARLPTALYENRVEDASGHELMDHELMGHELMGHELLSHEPLGHELSGPHQPGHLHNDYDFFMQFNNFKQIFGDDNASASRVAEIKDPLQTQDHQQGHQPLTFLCQWENCLQLVDNDSLLSHLLGSHLHHDPSGPAKLECEWDDCGFVNEDLLAFVDHLSSHKAAQTQDKTAQSTHTKQTHQTHHNVSPLLTPSSLLAPRQLPLAMPGTLQGQIQSHTEPPYLSYPLHASHASNPSSYHHGLPHSHGLSILEVRISPKASTSILLDPLHTCKWQIGSDESTGEPILCNRKHASDGELHKHLKIDHIGCGKREYHCCWHGCERHHGKMFRQRQKLFRHIHIHTGHKPCTCDVCGVLFAVPLMLKQHQRIHLGEKPYKCQECGRGFATSSLLAIHTRVHTDSRPLECTWPGCGRRFRESSNLAKHLRTHSTKFTCNECGKVLENRRSYTRHLKTHKSDSTAQEAVKKETTGGVMDDARDDVMDALEVGVLPNSLQT